MPSSLPGRTLDIAKWRLGSLPSGDPSRLLTSLTSLERYLTLLHDRSYASSRRITIDVGSGRYGDLYSGGDVSTVIKNALSEAADLAPYGPIVVLPAGNFSAWDLAIPRLTEFTGQGRSTVLTAPNGVTGSVIKLLNSSVERSTISNLWIQGNQASATVTGILIDNDGGTFTGADPEITLSNLLVTNLATDGIQVKGSRGFRVLNCKIRNALNDCWSAIDGSTDSSSDGIILALCCEASGRDLFNCQSGANIYIGIKGGAGGRYGFYTNSLLNTVVGCTIDGITPTCYRVEGPTNNFISCNCHDGGDATHPAIVLTSGADNCEFVGEVWTAAGSPQTKDAIDIQAGCVNSNVRLRTINISGSALVTGSDVTNNRVIINGIRQGVTGTYSPTITGVANVASSSTRTCGWYRVEDRVTVEGAVDVDPTAGSTLTIFRLSLPITSNLALLPDLSGFMWLTTGAIVINGGCKADTANDGAQFEYTCDAGAGSQTIHFGFTYQVK